MPREDWQALGDMPIKRLKRFCADEALRLSGTVAYDWLLLDICRVVVSLGTMHNMMEDEPAQSDRRVDDTWG